MRVYPLPKKVKSELSSLDHSHPLVASLIAENGATYSQLEDVAVLMPNSSTGEWASRVVVNESINRLRKIIDNSNKLPGAIVVNDDDNDVVIALKHEDKYFTNSGWVDSIDDADAELVFIDQESVAFVASAFMEGAEAVVLRQWAPVAYITAAAEGAEPAGASEVPDKSVVVAIVDELDKNAVLELIAVAPGPKVYRRHAGSWQNDDKWLQKIRQVVPPPMVKLEQAQVASVVSQVDEATVGEPFDEDTEDDAPVQSSIRASAGIDDEHVNRADEFAIRMALVAAKGNAAKGAQSAERLRKYWLSGKGAAKIRWGTKGDWTRCVRQLRKYLGPRAKGYCTLMHGRKLGKYPGHKHGTPPSPKVKAEAIAKQLAK